MKKILIDDADAVEKTVAILREGGVVIMPTDTVYGIGCAYDKPTALERIIALKGRDEQKPIALLAGSLAMAAEYAIILPKIKAGLMEVWPGPFTGVFQKISGEGKEGMRVPNHVFVRAVIDAYGKPLWMTSANKSGQLAQTHVAAVARDFQDATDSDMLMVDGGDIPDSMASTVVDFTIMPPKILRMGPVSRERLQEIFKTTFQ
ncbi:MAG: threonylcarbamoyl-AMP synthase [Candidatus Ryanbacteria bacterium]|nr:threonylcarbamoyl-AMP synthase [Candidatus Ryanbacteria bacterium]